MQLRQVAAHVQGAQSTALSSRPSSAHTWNVHRFAVVSCAAVLCLATGCASPARLAAGPHERPDDLGQVQSRPPPQGMKAEHTAGTVEVIRGTRIVAKVSVGPTGRFTVDLPAGTYLVKGHSVLWRGAE